MSLVADILAALLILAGTFFFTVGTLGLIRFPDVRSRLHALTKADNLGLGLVLAGAALWLGDWAIAGLMLLCWIFALAGASVSAHVIAGLEADHASEREPVHSVDPGEEQKNQESTTTPREGDQP
ncbi:monovalent cation/H(+) antiporter subunit G [Nesterenkonia sp. MY13]|uniref:Monovalent cation/H(+) antiporter subunit G n=1 Tax=Nesterenkonia sedimenti TaxID=1463632 RepID=A0A7X8YEH4_9MICC|nr:monovalent cation/H(+) antiporter subunit G [Nesterenkonia sedimenti]NLS10823.1 monovalent cation/H(+) antiporter subunit G [Nesterenkonia sedimenti]